MHPPRAVDGDDPIQTRDIVFALASLAFGIALDVASASIVGTLVSFPLVALVGVAVMWLDGYAVGRRALFNAAFATGIAALAGTALDIAGRLIPVFPYGYQVFSAAVALTFFAVFYRGDRLTQLQAVRAYFASRIGITPAPSRPAATASPKPAAIWLLVFAVIVVLVSIVDLASAPSTIALGGIGVAVVALVKRRSAIAFDASLAAIAMLVAALVFGAVHVPAVLDALLCTIVGYVVILHWREIPFAAALAQKASAAMTADFRSSKT